IDLTNRALAEIGTRSQITAFDDGSQEGQYAGLLYAGLRDFLLREGDYEFASTPVPSTIVTESTLPIPWIYAYQYPPDCVRVKQLVPNGFILLDPAPIEWTVVNNADQRVIATKA